ncbi:MAG TPA: hypothetical protein DCX44_11045 [Halomonas sp.]|nr:hypothetical protein [Halomonas sp.]
MVGKQGADQALLVDGLLFGAELFACAKFLHHVVHTGKRQRWVLGLLTLAVGVDLFGQLADLRRLLVGKLRKRESLEAAGFYIN